MDKLILDFTTKEGVIVSIALLIIIVLSVIANWRILEKAGEKGWKSLIPFYNLYTAHHIVGMSHTWFVLEIIFWFTELALDLIKGIPDSVVIACGIPIAIFTVIAELIYVNRLCDCFRKGIGFKIGMFFIPFIFDFILGYGKAEFHHPEEKQ
ncbi:MAG: hypothetical protein IJR57_04230 [Ruminococcus sp.]|nr:hypothetical protein [Ruminococcus sp.]